MNELSRRSDGKSTLVGTGKWKSARPCRACGQSGEFGCRVALDGGAATCRFSDTHPDLGRGRQEFSDRMGVWLYRFFAKGVVIDLVRGADDGPLAAEVHPDLGGVAAVLAEALTDERASDLAFRLGLPAWFVDVFRAFGVGYRKKRVAKGRDLGWEAGWRFPERDADDRVIGFAVRTTRTDDMKTERGTHRGLHLPPGWRERAVRSGYLLLVEGATDTMVCHAAGVATVGIPNLGGGNVYLAILLAGLPPHVKIIFVAERDEKPTGNWPGLSTTKRSARWLAKKLGRRVGWALVPGELGRAGRPAEFKDTRDWLTANAGRTRTSWEAAGGRYAKLILADAVFEAPAAPDFSVPPGLEFPARPCDNPYQIHLAGRDDQPRAGSHVYTRVRCKQWGCEHCRVENARPWLVHLAAKLEAADAAGDRPPGQPTHPQQPLTVDHLRLYFGEVTETRASVAVRSVTASAGDYARIVWSGSEDEPKSPEEETRTVGDSGSRSGTDTSVVFRVFAAVPADQKPPKHLRPIGLAEAVALLRETLAAVGPAGGRHPVRTSPDWRLPEREPSHWTVGKAAALAPEQVTEAAAAVGLAAPIRVRHADIRGHQAGVAGPAIHAWLFAELVAGPPGGPAPAVADVVDAYRRWAPHLPANTVAGWGVKDVIEGRLWAGPDAPTLVRLADAIERAPELEQFFKDTEGIRWPGEPDPPPPKLRRVRPSAKDRRYQARLKRAKTGDGNPILDTIRH